MKYSRVLATGMLMLFATSAAVRAEEKADAAKAQLKQVALELEIIRTRIVEMQKQVQSTLEALENTKSETAQAATPAGKLTAELARDIKNDLRLLDSATDQWAIEFNMVEGAVASPENIAQYLKTGSSLQVRLSTGDLKDRLGNPLSPFKVDTLPRVHPKTVEAFKDVVGADYWDPFNSLRD